jgi:hypothetical protein
MKNRFAGLLVATAAVPLLVATPAHAGSPDTYCFAKSALSPGVWRGTYAPVPADGSCDATNGLPMASHLTAPPVITGNIAHIEIVWEFFDAEGDLVFQTVQAGILSLGSGDVVLNGTVTAGDRLGARTHDEGTPTDANGSYAGIMRLQS